MAQPRCPICDAAFSTCGPAGPVEPAGRIHQFPEEDPMSLQEYKVVINGVETTAQLTPAHAARLGGVPIDAEPPEPEEGEPKAVKGKARRPANKATA